MTQANDQNGSSRLDRIEAIMLDLVSASVWHDNALTKLSEGVTRHNDAIARHDKEFSRINANLNRVSEQQQFNNEQLATLTAGLLELRNLVTDYLEGNLSKAEPEAYPPDQSAHHRHICMWPGQSMPCKC